ncbi:MAG: hypothetical protein IT337_11090, partial [Thermomicrobiales bacterium]|nr:hypothetical protein [Thermomicrobiales bacterium]
IVLLGTAMWLNAHGQQFWKVGVEPDAVVDMPLDAVPSRPRDDVDVTPDELAALPDPQLRAAWGVLRVELLPKAEPAPLPAPPVLSPPA